MQETVAYGAAASILAAKFAQALSTMQVTVMSLSSSSFLLSLPKGNNTFVVQRSAD